MSLHIGAKPGEIAETVLIAGDPLRAKNVAEKMLENPLCYSQIRGMLGFTGTYNGKRVSIQGTGMGLPSTAIYLHELISDYGVKKVVRIGTCGSIQEYLDIGDVILATSASTDSNINRLIFKGMDYAPTPDFETLMRAHEAAKMMGIKVTPGPVFSADSFYNADPDHWKLWSEYGILGMEMETSLLYTVAAKFKVKALTILSVSDSLITHSSASAEEREKKFMNMAKIALSLVD
ncbi:MAG: purine-nucleoside phosphorylase [Crocinitomicaceae bacterium]|nr:purine-nucleoside phosphorylase [Crocinitomicaceae bacterium]